MFVQLQPALRLLFYTAPSEKHVIISQKCLKGENISKVHMEDRINPKFLRPNNLVRKISLLEVGKSVKFRRHICFQI